MRIYENNDGTKIKSIAIYARQYIYAFVQVYEDSPDFLNELVNGFKSSRTGCIQNAIAMWADRCFGNHKETFSSTLTSVFLGIWCTAVFLILLLFWGAALRDNLFWNILVTITCLLLFSFLVLHDYLLDWFMGYDSFWKLFFGLILMFLED